MTNIIEIKKEALVLTLREERGENFDIKDIKVQEFNSNVFETYYSELINQDEYLVLTEQERDEEHKENFESLIDDLGLESFSKVFQNWIVDNALEGNFFYEVVKESFEYYIDDIREEGTLEEEMEDYGVDSEEDFLELLIEGVDDYYQYCLDNYGKDWVVDCIDNGSIRIDWEKVREECIEVDGYSNLLARYDGEEMEIFVGDLQEILYIYRIN